MVESVSAGQAKAGYGPYARPTVGRLRNAVLDGKKIPTQKLFDAHKLGASGEWRGTLSIDLNFPSMPLLLSPMRLDLSDKRQRAVAERLRKRACRWSLNSSQ